MCSTNEFLAESQKDAVDVSLSLSERWGWHLSHFSSLSFTTIKEDYLINVCVILLNIFFNQVTQFPAPNFLTAGMQN